MRGSECLPNGSLSDLIRLRAGPFNDYPGPRPAADGLAAVPAIMLLGSAAVPVAQPGGTAGWHGDRTVPYCSTVLRTPALTL